LLNNEVVVLPEYEKTAPFHLHTLKFFDELDEAKRVCKERFKYERGNLAKNGLVLEHVVLQRNVKRELNVEKKRREKEKDLKMRREEMGMGEKNK
jgi:hypothetical protein